MSLLHLTIWKYVNFLDRKFIYDILRGGMASTLQQYLNLGLEKEEANICSLVGCISLSPF